MFLRTIPCLTFLSLAVGQTQIADIVFDNGKIWTVDKARPTAEAIAVLNGKILAVGS